MPVRWVHLRDEIAAAGLLIVRGQLSVLGWLRGFWGKRLTVAEFAWDDMYPGILFWAQVPKRLLELARPRPPQPSGNPSAEREGLNPR